MDLFRVSRGVVATVSERELMLLLVVGTPPQTVTVSFDTGSSDVVIPISSCDNCSQPLFNEGSSSSYSATTTPVTISFTDGRGASGVVASETISVGGLAVTGQNFAAVTTETGGFNQSHEVFSTALFQPYSGFLGLGFPSQSATHTTPFFFNLASQGRLASNVFSIFLDRQGGNGSQTYWNVATDGLQYNGTILVGPFSAIVDTGASFIYVPVLVSQALYSLIPGGAAAPASFGPGFYTFTCDAIDNTGSIAIEIGGSPFVINLVDFNFGPIESGSKTCLGGVVGLDLPGGFGILGQEFIKTWYTIFDLGNSRIGFAKGI
ncbi:hypothetical protein FRB99_003736 [Tulasnella sp. 403]|nr:hypothetical protein FRB99_003736 [Tulasnella sp. 403]